MRRKSTCWVWFVVMGMAVGAVYADIDSGLVGYWPLNEGTGTATADMSGNGHDGTLYKGATWIAPGLLGSAAVQVDGNPGSRVGLGTWDPGDRFTLAIWAKWTGEQNKAERTGLIGKRNNWTATDIRWFIEVMITGQVRMRNFTQTVSSPAGAMTAWIDDWVHVAVTCDGSTARIYLNGEQVGSGNFTPGPSKTAGLGLGCKEGGSNSNTEIFSGSLDEARIYDRVLSVGDLKELFEWTDLPGKAAGPRPADGQTDVARDVLLTWTAGEFAPATGGHRVYFSESQQDVSDGVGASVQDANSYAPPQPLGFGKTYYWRVDEVNDTPDKTVFKGPVWSFTVEPYAFPVRPVRATASSMQPDMGPEKTIDGSGLTGDRHGVDSNTMWVSTGLLPNWIQYEFDNVYKLHEMTIWNSNQALEGFLGFGAKSVTIETSIDGATWTAAADVPEFARAPGAAGYTANTTVNLAGAVAQYIKLTINSTWSGMGPASLSEVRFSSIPVRARLPQPAAGMTDVDVAADLDWRPGREAASHRVYFGADANAVADGIVPAQVVADHGYDPGSLDFGTTYYWKVDEVNEAMDPSLHEGQVWSFTTREYATVDDMESYTDAEGSRIYEAWIDGYADKSSGSVIGYMEALNGTFGERKIVHGGRQSMPFEYNNADQPFYSEAYREFSPVEDWTINGADTLSLWVRGNPTAYVDNAGTITMTAGGHDIWDNADDFRFAHKALTGNGSVVVKVESLVNTHNWAKAGVMIRQSLAADSSFVYFIVSAAQGVSMGWRPLAATTCDSVTQAGIPAPQWVKLTRTGDVFTAQYSADGQTWIDLKAADGTIASTSVMMTGPVSAGLCLTSHDPAKTTTAVMSEAAVTGTISGSWQVATIGDDPQPANDPGDLYVTVQDSAGKTATAVHQTAVTSGEWTQWKIPLDSLAGVNMAKVKRLYLGVGSKTSPTQGGRGLLYIDDIGVGHPRQ